MIVSKACTPTYSSDAAYAKATGKTRIQLTIDETGHPVDAKIVASSGSDNARKSLDRATFGVALRDFQPAQDSDGKPVTGSLEIAYNWVLH